MKKILITFSLMLFFTNFSYSNETNCSDFKKFSKDYLKCNTDRDNIYKARIKILINELGEKKLKDLVDERFKKFRDLFSELNITKNLNEKLEIWSYKSLNETTRIAEEIKKYIKSEKLKFDNFQSFVKVLDFHENNYKD